MNKLEKNKKTIGVYLLIIIFLIYIAEYIILKPSMLKMSISFSCVMLGYISFAFMKTGITGLLISIFNISIYTTITYAIGKLAVKENIPFFPLFIIAIVLFSLVYFYVDIPKRLLNFINKKIFKIKDENVKKNIITYNEYKEAQKIKVNVSRKNSILNLNLFGKIRRIIFTLFMIAISTILLLTNHPIYSLLFLSCGISTFLFGIYNGLKIVLLLQVYMAVFAIIKEYLQITPKNYFEYYLTLLLIGIFNIVIFTKIFIKIYKKNNEYINLVNFKIGDEYNSCDVFLDLVKPIQNYNILLKLCMDVKLDDGEITYKFANKMNKLADDLYKLAINEQYIIAGTSLNKLTEKSYTYVYVREEEKEYVVKKLNKVATDYGYKLYIEEEINDPNWEYYTKNIFPDKYIVQEIINKNYINMLVNLNLKEEDDHKIFYYFYFNTIENATDFAKEIKKKYFDVESVDDLSAVRKNLNLTKEQNYGVIISNNSRIGLQKMNIQTRILIDAAEKNKGKFDGWTVQETKKNFSNSQ